MAGRNPTNQDSWSARAVPAVFFYVAGVFGFWFSWSLATPLIPKVISGYFLEVHAAVVVGSSMAVFRQRREHLARLRPSAVCAFAVGYGAWGISDGCWALNYFIENNSSQVTLGIAVTSLCCVSFCAFSLGIVLAHQDVGKLFADKRIVVVALLVGSGAIATLLLLPCLDASCHAFGLPFSLSELAAIVSGYVLLLLSIAVLLSSRRLAWSILGGGLMCLVLGDSSIRIGKLLNDSVDLDVFSVLCSFGLYTALLPLLSHRDKEPIDPPDFSSLFTLFKFGSIAILFACLLTFTLVQTKNLENIKVITLCCGFGSIAAAFFSWMVVARVKAISTDLGRILQGDLGDAKALTETNTPLPLELREYYDYVLGSAIAEHKALERSKQLDDQHRMLRRVAHNILSPVAALQSQIGDLRSLPEDTRLVMKTAIHDIHDMAHGLSAAGKRNKASVSMEKIHLLSTMESSLAQKRLQHKKRKGVSIECKAPASYSAFAHVQELELRSIISNLLNNAVEALPSTGGEVTVGISESTEEVVISVRDTGKGIPPERLAQLGQEGRTFDKVGGSGIGLHHARCFAEAWGGRMELSSELGAGTQVSIVLPNRGPAPWFVEHITLSPKGTVVVLDDSPAIHQVWAQRLAHHVSTHGITIVNCFTMEEFRSWQEGFPADKHAAVSYLLDFELDRNSSDGIALAQEMQICPRSILVTSHHGSSDVRNRCATAGLKMIPKSMAGVVPLRLLPTDEQLSEHCDVVLIDDDAVFRKIWQKRAAKNGMKLRAFASVNDFTAQCVNIAKTTPIYIDSDLGTSQGGEVEAQAIKEQHGYETIYLASAFPPEGADKLPWLAGIADKLPPWPDK